jgi:hypothetical protein
MVMPTNRTTKTVRPPLNKKIISASFLSTEPCVELYQIPWKIWEGIVLHPLYFKEHGNMSQVEKPIMGNRPISSCIGQEIRGLWVEICMRLGCLLGIEIGWSVIEGRLF